MTLGHLAFGLPASAAGLPASAAVVADGVADGVAEAVAVAVAVAVVVGADVAAAVAVSGGIGGAGGGVLSTPPQARTTNGAATKRASTLRMGPHGLAECGRRQTS